VIFLYGLPKNGRSNITGKEHEALSTIADTFIAATDNDKQVADLVANGSVFELEYKRS
jgi:hypothetical protein